MSWTVIDSGVTLTHDEFSDDSPQPRARHGYDFVDDDVIASDCDGHGTHVRNTILPHTAMNKLRIVTLGFGTG
jgi:subtilisin family serine protease